MRDQTQSAPEGYMPSTSPVFLSLETPSWVKGLGSQCFPPPVQNSAFLHIPWEIKDDWPPEGWCLMEEINMWAAAVNAAEGIQAGKVWTPPGGDEKDKQHIPRASHRCPEAAARVKTDLVVNISQVQREAQSQSWCRNQEDLGLFPTSPLLPPLPPPTTITSSGCKLHLESHCISRLWVVIRGRSRFAFIEVVCLDHSRQWSCWNLCSQAPMGCLFTSSHPFWVGHWTKRYVQRCPSWNYL